MGSTTQRSSMDATVRSNTPTRPVPQFSVMTVENGTNTRIPHLLTPAPCPFGCTVTSAKLRLVQAAASSGNRTLSLYRITKSWNEQKLTWKNRPTRAATPSATVTVTGAGSKGRVVEFDVTDDVQKFVDGSWKNFGWTIESNNGNEIAFSTRESVRNQPTLTVTWSDRPETPTDMVPAGGGVVSTPKPRLRWSFIDRAGNTTLGAVQVQLKATSDGWTPASGFTAATFDSGVVTATQPQLDLATTGWGGLAAGGEVWWTVRHRDGAGLWSSWSDPHKFSYQPLTAVSMASPGPTVTDTTFPWVWSTASQSKFQVIIRDGSGTLLWHSGIVAAPDVRAFTQPRGVITTRGDSYIAVLRVWDAYPRQDVPGHPGYVEISQPFTYVDTPDVAPVNGLYAQVDSGASWVQLTWSRSEMPDMFSIWVDGQLHTAATGADFHVGGTSYAYTMRDLPPRANRAINVKAIRSDGDVTKSSANNATVEAFTDPIGVRVIDPDTEDLDVVLLEEPGAEIVSSSMPEVVERFDPIGSPRSVQVTSALRWFEGTVDGGILADYNGVTAGEYRRRLLAMKSDPISDRVLIWGRNAVPVFLSQINITDDPIASAERYRVSFEFLAARPSPEYQLS